ncbi:MULTISPECIES: pyrroline-5-carboxylate reductase dimerization domain-containing protein [unclassified Mesorhizobium]|uniref:pyrroline-5-carboxylate reductase family protein n=1 Tax=unclassified Mesorhizobium TaxID=325217 RepID=UPI000FCBE0FC|nr:MULTISPECIES: pyrroline-5-carboxylate reductase dimerization domain-containing protein [unclassified Mesorhizobium]TGP20329.1 pyrroline-5-carboxylate reductase [Mesorhizobium sp. M1D.F.Ca.ET.231.01.1.1]TGP27806.1 pyrroline-5-carboxylate reductase [Mesorhizobium sp. M1D.F.Ca.ET.234.01.1.1]TGS42156.1 pyrroline-5-carboxylate reductase [Mesorhizobium sp. M1D.F.Ca.ET.184.01.1.1]TGS59508.1 pyrroline-5-carboxylate reductase [Mesorhizobium sp. M1D.F.Ca.ET.183.01.1.1]
MSASIKLGIVGGAGWLGGAIAGAALAAGVLRAEDLALSYRSTRPDRFPGAFWTDDNQALADRSDVVMLSVRPQDWPSLELDAKGKLVISVMAGIRLAEIGDKHGTSRVVRTLPNAAAEVVKSYTPWIASSEATEQDRTTVRAIFAACGVEDEVGSERDIDYLTGLTGSGPAFPALLANAMMRDAIAFGLSTHVARRAVNTVLTGTGRLLELSDASPADTVEAFLDYRGTTAAAIETMREAGFEEAVAKGLAAAFRKSIAMGKK